MYIRIRMVPILVLNVPRGKALSNKQVKQEIISHVRKKQHRMMQGMQVFAVFFFWHSPHDHSYTGT